MFNDEFMLINKSQLSLDEDHICRKTVNATDRSLCSIQCSQNQPFDFWLFDKVKQLLNCHAFYIRFSRMKSITNRFITFFVLTLNFLSMNIIINFIFLYHINNSFILSITLKQRHSIGLE